MPNFPPSATGLNYITYPVGPTAAGATLTANASNNTKGSYTQLVASTPFAANWVIVTVTGMTASRKYLFDIATGGAGAETDVLSNLLADGPTAAVGDAGAASHIFPLAIASGVRLSARCQSSTGSSTLQIAVTLIAAGGAVGASTFTTYGADTAASGGVAVNAGASTNTKGSYAQITASTSGVIQWLIVMCATGGNTAPAAANFCVDIATGGAGSEVVLIPDVRMSTTAQITAVPASFPAFTYIPASTRLAIRMSSGTNDATDRILEFIIVAALAPSEGVVSGVFRSVVEPIARQE